jgi:hypothetical protein
MPQDDAIENFMMNISGSMARLFEPGAAGFGQLA